MLDINPIVFLIPLISGLVGWFTNWVAVKAMLYPTKFIGLRLFGRNLLGWQGVIPKNVEVLSANFGKTIEEKFIDLDELFAGIQYENNSALDKLIQRMTDQVIEEFSTKMAPEKWARAKDKLRQYIRLLVANSVRQVLENIFDEMGKEAKEFIDVKAMVQEAMVEDRELLGKILFEIGGPEFIFIERSGLLFGFLFGLLQMTVWLIYPAVWLLPVAGFLVGYITNYLAMTLIFEPADPIKLGPYTIQGLFIKRQKEVASKFADSLVESVLTAENIVKQFNRGPSREPVLAIIEGQIESGLEKYAKDPMVAMLVSKQQLADARADAKQRLRASDLESNNDTAQVFAQHSPKMRSQIAEKIRAMDANEFCLVLRPVFKEDEWQLILAGGVLGFIAGVLQWVYIFADYVA